MSLDLKYSPDPSRNHGGTLTWKKPCPDNVLMVFFDIQNEGYRPARIPPSLHLVLPVREAVSASLGLCFSWSPGWWCSICLAGLVFPCLIPALTLYPIFSLVLACPRFFWCPGLVVPQLCPPPWACLSLLPLSLPPRLSPSWLDVVSASGFVLFRLVFLSLSSQVLPSSFYAKDACSIYTAAHSLLFDGYFWIFWAAATRPLRSPPSSRLARLQTLLLMGPACNSSKMWNFHMKEWFLWQISRQCTGKDHQKGRWSERAQS